MPTFFLVFFFFHVVISKRGLRGAARGASVDRKRWIGTPRNGKRVLNVNGRANFEKIYITIMKKSSSSSSRLSIHACVHIHVQPLRQSDWRMKAPGGPQITIAFMSSPPRSLTCYYRANDFRSVRLPALTDFRCSTRIHTYNRRVRKLCSIASVHEDV